MTWFLKYKQECIDLIPKWYLLARKQGQRGQTQNVYEKVVWSLDMFLKNLHFFSVKRK